MTVRCVYSSWSGNGESINQKMQMRREQNRKIAKQPYKTQSKTGKFLSKSATVTRLCSVISINGKVLRGYVSCGPKITLSISDVQDYDVTRYGNWVNMGKTDQCTWDMMHTTWQLCRLHSNSNFEAWFFHHRHWKSCFYGIIAECPRESRLNSHVSRFQNQTIWSNHYEINPRNPE